MNASDYRMEAALFFAKSAQTRNKSLSFRRFDQAAEAIRFAVEELSPKIFSSCSLEVNGEHYFGREIRPLYDSTDYPLRRRASGTEESPHASA